MASKSNSNISIQLSKSPLESIFLTINRTKGLPVSVSIDYPVKVSVDCLNLNLTLEIKSYRLSNMSSNKMKIMLSKYQETLPEI